MGQMLLDGLMSTRARRLKVDWVAGGGDQDGDWAIGVAYGDCWGCDVCRVKFQEGDWVVWCRYQGKERISHFLQHKIEQPIGKPRGWIGGDFEQPEEQLEPSAGV